MVRVKPPVPWNAEHSLEKVTQDDFKIIEWDVGGACRSDRGVSTAAKMQDTFGGNLTEKLIHWNLPLSPARHWNCSFSVSAHDVGQKSVVCPVLQSPIREELGLLAIMTTRPRSGLMSAGRHAECFMEPVITATPEPKLADWNYPVPGLRVIKSRGRPDDIMSKTEGHLRLFGSSAHSKRSPEIWTAPAATTF